MRNLKLILTTALFTTLFSCVNGDDYGTPTDNCNDLVANVTVQSVTSSATSSATEYMTDDIIEAYVTSSDQGGNFYKSISFSSLDGTVGFSMPIDNYNLYTKYEPGRKVFIKMQDRFFNTQNNSTVIGSDYAGGVGRISGVEYQSIITRSCTKVNEDDIVKHLTITQAKNDQNLNMLVEFDAVQFTDPSLDKTYFDASLNNIGGATNHEITDEYGNKITVRISEYASFASGSVPNESGKIRGVLTKYSGTYQFMVRTLNDIKLTDSRMEIDFYPPLGGTNIQYLGARTENFESYTSGTVTTGQKIFPNYVNDANMGGNYWYVESYSGNKYLKMSAFSSSTTYQYPVNKVYFIMPVDFTSANNMSFKTQDRYNVGGVLKVYYSSDYAPLTNISTATLTDITSNFTIASGTTGGTSLPFVNSGSYAFPGALTGNGFVIFEYTGGYSFNPVLTTTMHIDDITIN